MGCLGRSPVPATDGGSDERSSSPGSELPRECPEYDRVQRVVCYGAAEIDGVDAYLDPSARTVLPGEPVEFTLRNRSDRTLETNFYDWAVHKRVDGTWYHVTPRAVPQPLMHVPAGQEHTWTVTVDDGGIEDGEHVPSTGGTEELTLRGLGGGDYAFRARGWFEGDGHEEAVAFAAPFVLDTESLELTSTSAIEGAEWAGDTLVARSTRRDPDEADTRLGAFELERVDAPAQDATTVIVEQVVRNDRLRDVLALALEHGADRVRLEEYDSTVPIFGSRSDRIYEFQGSHYQVTTRELKDRA